MIANSTRPLPGGANAAPAEVAVSPDGEVLVVTEKDTNMIDLFPIGNFGQLSPLPAFPRMAGLRLASRLAEARR